MQSPDVDPAGWERVLQRSRALPVEKLVPGHGEIGPTTGIADLARVRQQRVTRVARKIADSRTRTTTGSTRRSATPENSIENVSLTAGAHRQRQGSVKALRDQDARKADARRHAGADPREEVRR